jgi:hypothetical protein
MSHKKDHQKSKEALIALAGNDTTGLPCPGRLNCPTGYSSQEIMFESFHRPAIDCLLNYDSYEAIGAV